VARALRPAPNALAFNTRLERWLAANPEGQSGDARARQFQDSVMRAYGVTSLDSLPVNFAGLRLEEGERHGDRIFDAAYGALADTYRAQDVVRSALGALAPLLAVRELSMALAGTDPEEHRRFQRAAELYRRDFVNRMNMLMAANSRTSDGTRVTVDSAAWKTVPPFEYEEPGVATVLAQQRSNVFVLLAWVLATAGLLRLAIRHMSIDAGAVA
jgi:ABC-2 type transport system permease protein